jgi:23S rRNA pseudouridine1911/1915/1917 synthase
VPRLELMAGAAQAGRRLDALLAERPEIGSRVHAERLLRAGRVTVDGRRRPKSHCVAAGERIVADLDGIETGVADPARAGPGAAAARADVPHTVVHEDDHLIVVDKPAGVVVHPGHGTSSGTLADALSDRAAGGPPERAGIVHRLDRDTSGLLVVAKSETAHAALSGALRRREVRREYLALVEGVPAAETGTIDAAVGRDRSDRTIMSTRTDRPRSARTHFSVREGLARTALLDIRLETGRTHQIRTHLAAIGHPVCGDERYGGGGCGRRLGLRRPFLHSARLSFVHPATGAERAFQAPLPAELRAALESARAEGSG